MNSELELVREQRELLISERKAQEIMINEWAKKLAQVDPDILKGVDLPPEISLKSLIPELYVDEPNAAVYEEQYDKTCELFNKINAIAEEYNKEAMRCLQEFNQAKTMQS